jgi:hypothetical protein
MRRTGLLLAAAAVLVTGLSTAPARAHDGWYGDGGYGSQDDGWRERASRWHEWRRQWWREHHPYWGYYNYGSYAPPTAYYAAPSWYSQPAPYGYTGYGN